MKIYKIYLAVSAVFIMLIAAAGGIIEAENNTRRVAFGEDAALPVISFSQIEEIIKNTGG